MRKFGYSGLLAKPDSANVDGRNAQGEPIVQTLKELENEELLAVLTYLAGNPGHGFLD